MFNEIQWTNINFLKTYINIFRLFIINFSSVSDKYMFPMDF